MQNIIVFVYHGGHYEFVFWSSCQLNVKICLERFFLRPNTLLSHSQWPNASVRQLLNLPGVVAQWCHFSASVREQASRNSPLILQHHKASLLPWGPQQCRLLLNNLSHAGSLAYWTMPEYLTWLMKSSTFFQSVRFSALEGDCSCCKCMEMWNSLLLLWLI